MLTISTAYIQQNRTYKYHLALAQVAHARGHQAYLMREYRLAHNLTSGVTQLYEITHPQLARLPGQAADPAHSCVSRVVPAF
jgi:hypothetical protein